MSEQAPFHQRLKTFPNLKPEDFQHPWDRQAISVLQAIPGFEYLIKKLMEHGFEQFFRITNLASNIHATGNMFPKLQESLKFAARIMNVDEPDLYVTTDPNPNAFTYGHTRPFIVVTSGLVESTNEEERFFVLAHELGHIKCGHVLYKTMARHFKVVLDIAASATFGLSGLISAGLEMALFDWQRKSELSADRAGLICIQNQHIVNKAFMKLAAGSPKLYNQMDEKEFIRQIRSYEDAADESFINKAYTALVTAHLSHPFLVMRAKHLDSWVQSGDFTNLTGINQVDLQKEENDAIIVEE